MNAITKNTSTEQQENTPQNTIVGGAREVIEITGNSALEGLPEQRENMGVLLNELQEVVEKRSREIDYDYRDYEERLLQSDEFFERTLKQVLSVPKIGALYKRIIDLFPLDVREVAEQRIVEEYLEDLVFESMERRFLKVPPTIEVMNETSSDERENLKKYQKIISDLKKIGLQEWNFYDHDLQIFLEDTHFMEMIQTLIPIKRGIVYLGGNNLGELDTDIFLSSIELIIQGDTRVLDIDRNNLCKNLGADGMLRLAEKLRGKKLKKLYIGGNCFLKYQQKNEAIEFARALKGSVRYIEFGGMEFFNPYSFKEISIFFKELYKSGVRQCSIKNNALLTLQIKKYYLNMKSHEIHKKRAIISGS